MNDRISRSEFLFRLTAVASAALVPTALAGCGGTALLRNYTYTTRIALPAGGSGRIESSSFWVFFRESGEHFSAATGMGGLTVNASATAPPGRYVLRITLNDDESDPAPSRQSFEAIVVEPGCGVGLTVNEEQPAIDAGRTMRLPVTATAIQTIGERQAGFSGTVTFRVDGLPAGINARFEPPSVTLQPGEEKAAELFLTADANVADATVTLRVLGDHGNPTRTATTSRTLAIRSGTPPTPTPRPTPTPLPVADGLTFTPDPNRRAPIIYNAMNTTGGWFYEGAGRGRLGATYGNSGMAQRDFTMLFLDPDGEVDASTSYPYLPNPPTGTGCRLTFVQYAYSSGDMPYYQSYQAVADARPPRLEFASDGRRLRVILDAPVRFERIDTPTGDAFLLSGTFVLNR